MKQKIICHLITGFTGSGKTTFIKRLLTYKPEGETWAVLVNENGNTNYNAVKKDVFIKEVYGGCPCCSAGIPFRVALNSLIKEVSPQRILIEVSGAGHLANMNKLLQDPFYQPVLNLQTSICLVAKHQLEDKKYAQNETYLSSIEQADKLCTTNTELDGVASELAKRYVKPLCRLQNDYSDLDIFTT